MCRQIVRRTFPHILVSNSHTMRVALPVKTTRRRLDPVRRGVTIPHHPHRPRDALGRSFVFHGCADWGKQRPPVKPEPTEANYITACSSSSNIVGCRHLFVTHDKDEASRGSRMVQCGMALRRGRASSIDHHHTRSVVGRSYRQYAAK